MTEEKSISTLDEYVKIICGLPKKHKRGGVMQKSAYYFRGQASEAWDLEPSLARCMNNKSFEYERNLIDMAKFRMPDMFNNNLSPVELLALLQHYGIPTRLLDVTENALVALYFACKGEEESDGRVTVFHSEDTLVSVMPVHNAIAESYLLTIGDVYWLEDFYDSAIKRPYFNEQSMIAKHKDSASGAKWLKRCMDETMFVMAPTRSIRQQIQAGRYILFPNDIEEEKGKYSFLKDISPMSDDDKCIEMNIKVNCKYKESILDSLRLLGISEGTLFPDNIDKVCNEIKETAPYTTMWGYAE